LSLALSSTMLTNVALLIQKYSAKVEQGRALLPRLCNRGGLQLSRWRWRFWCGFFLNTGSEAFLSSFALVYTPLALLAPLGGVGVAFNALLARWGIVCGQKEVLSRAEWASTLLVLVGVTSIAVSGPGSQENAEITVSDTLDAFRQPVFVALIVCAVTLVVSVVLLFHDMPRFSFVRSAGGSLPCIVLRTRPWFLTAWRPHPGSALCSALCGSSAACCGTFSVIFLKVVMTTLTKADFSAPLFSAISLVGVATVAPLQLYLLNLSLASGTATFTLPVYLVLIMFFISVSGGVLYDEWSTLSRPPQPFYLTMYLCGVLLFLSGLSCLAASQQRRHRNTRRFTTPSQTGESDLPTCLTSRPNNQICPQNELDL